jgi:hypothetical protein
MIQTTKGGLASVIAAINNAIPTLEVDDPIQDLKGRRLTKGDLVVLVDAESLDNDDITHEVGDIFQFIGGEVDNIGCFMHCKYNKRSDFFADRTLKINKLN